MNILYNSLAEPFSHYSINKFSDINMLNYRITFYLDQVIDFYATNSFYLPSNHSLVKLVNRIIPSDDYSIMNEIDNNKKMYEMLFKFISNTNGMYNDITYISTTLNEEYEGNNLRMISSVYHQETELAFTSEPFKDEVMTIDIMAIALTYSRMALIDEDLTPALFVSRVLLPKAILSRFNLSIINIIMGGDPVFTNKLPISLVDLTRDITKFSTHMRKGGYRDSHHYITALKQLIDIPDMLRGIDEDYNNFTFWITDLINTKFAIFLLRYVSNKERIINDFRNVSRIRRGYIDNVRRYKRRRLDYISIVIVSETVLNPNAYSGITKEFKDIIEIKDIAPLLLPSNEVLLLPMIDSRLVEYYELLNATPYSYSDLIKLNDMKVELNLKDQ